MKLAGFLLIFGSVLANAQSAPQYGHRIGGGVAFLTESSEIKEPDSPGDGFVASAESLRVMMQNLERGRLERLANSTGADQLLFMTNADGSKTLLLTQNPSAVFETWAEHRSSDYVESNQTGFTGIERTEGKAILRRFVRDDIRKIYVRYAATLETVADGVYRLSLGSSNDQFPADLRGKADWKLISPTTYPVPQTLKEDDSIRLELYSSDGRKLVDYIHAGRSDQMVMRKEAAHDYYADDAELTVSRPRVRVNGTGSDAVTITSETIRGPVLWIYVPGHGRYVLSLHPHPELGFASAGEVSGKSLTFTTADGNVFIIESIERIAAGSGTYAMNVLPDSVWEPADPRDRTWVMIGAAPGLVGTPEH